MTVRKKRKIKVKLLLKGKKENNRCSLVLFFKKWSSYNQVHKLIAATIHQIHLTIRLKKIYRNCHIRQG